MINWNTVTADTRAEVLYCFSTIAGGDDALMNFGELMKNYMLEASEEELLAIKPETEIAKIVIHDIPETLKHLPKEDLISISQVEKELRKYLTCVSCEHFICISSHIRCRQGHSFRPGNPPLWELSLPWSTEDFRVKINTAKNCSLFEKFVPEIYKEKV